MPVELGFPVVLYGTIYTELVATSNGYLSTDLAERGGDASPNCPLPAVPSEGGGTRIYVLHDDQTLDASSAGVCYQYFKTSPHPHSKMGVSVFTWDNLRFDGGSALPLNFQVLLFDDGDILLQYDTSGVTWGTTSTVGLLEADAADGLLYSCKAAGAITDDLAVAFIPPTISVTGDGDALDTPSGPFVTLREALRDIPSGGRKWGPKVDIGASEMGTLFDDNDNDSMDDVWERYYGLNPGSSSDASGNLDFDGTSNLEEYQGMTDPEVVNVIAPPESIEWESTGGFLIGSFVSAPGIHYNMRITQNVKDTNGSSVPYTGAAGSSETSFNFQPYQPISGRIFTRMETAD